MLMSDDKYVRLFGHLPAKDVDEIVQAVTGLKIIEGDKGPRGAIYNWRVMYGDREVYASPQKNACSGFVQGVFRAKLA